MKNQPEAVRLSQAHLSGTKSQVKVLTLFGADIIAALISLTLSVTVTNIIRQALEIPIIGINSDGLQWHISICATLTLILFIWLRSKGHYSSRQALVDQIAAVVAGTVLCALCAATIQFITVEVGSRLLTLSYWALLGPFCILIRYLCRSLLRATNFWSNSAALMAPFARMSELTALLERRNEIGLHASSLIYVDTLDSSQLSMAVEQASNRGETIIYAPAPGDQGQRQIIDNMVRRGVSFLLSPDIGPLPNHADILQFPPHDTTLVEIKDPLDRPLAIFLKRTVDIVVSALALLFLLPIMVTIALLIQRDGGPVLFKQKRVGFNGQTFHCYKFRSMMINAEDVLIHMIETDPEVASEWKAYQKLRNDPRITTIGRFIRKTNLDELPQLINILKGDMSLVGPRPMTVPQIEEYGDIFEAYKRVLPGITGMWQVNGRNDTTFSERARLDAYYVRNWSLWRDIVILVRTVKEVLLSKGI